MRWWLKAAVQKGISLLPAGRSLHHLLQRRLWRSLKINEAFLEDRLSHVGKHLRAWHLFHPHRLPDRSLELGTGWYPIVPIGLYLSGIDQIYTVDQNPYLSIASFAELMNWLEKWQNAGLLHQYLPSLRPERWQLLQNHYQAHSDDLTRLLQKLNIHYWVGDARNLAQTDGYFELIHSNNTFEHIDSTILSDLLAELQRTLKAGACMSHYIDLADHYSYGDAQLSPFHFLRFTERQWSWIENRFQSQNRLRINQYEAIYRELGIESKRLEVEYGTPLQLSQVNLASPYSEFPKEEVSVLYAQLVHQKVGGDHD